MKFTMPDGEVIDQKNWPQFKTPYNHDTNFESDRTAYYDDEPSLTKQEFKDQVDLNLIIKRALATGEPPPLQLPEHFGVVNRTTFHEMASQVAEANAHFYQLNADLRAQFQNDPTQWADAIMIALGNGDTDTLNQLGIQATKKPLDGEPTGGAPASTPVANAPGAADPAAPAATAAGAPNVTPA